MLNKKLVTSISKNTLPKDHLIQKINSFNITLKLSSSSQKKLPKSHSKSIIKPKIHFEVPKFNSISPRKSSIILNLKKEAIHRPYKQDEHMPIVNKDFSINHRNLYWRKKKLEQYKKAKNLEPRQSLVPRFCVNNKNYYLRKAKSRNSDGPIKVHIKRSACSLSMSTADFRSTPNQDFSSTSSIQKFVYNRDFAQTPFVGKYSTPLTERTSENYLKTVRELGYKTMYSRFESNHSPGKSLDSVDNNFTP